MTNTLPTQQSWIERFDGLKSLSDKLKKELLARSRLISVGEGRQIFGPGKAPEHLLLLLEGTVRVQQISEQGREIFLYRVDAGQSCVLTSACMLAYEGYLAEGLAETDIVGVAIPKVFFEELLAESTEFRRFVFTAYSRRITDLFKIIDDVAFGRVDIRLASVLLKKYDQALADHKSPKLKITQQDLAAELGSAREVISRQLQEFKRRNWVKAGRGWIEIVAADEMRKLATTK